MLLLYYNCVGVCPVEQIHTARIAATYFEGKKDSQCRHRCRDAKNPNFLNVLAKRSFFAYNISSHPGEITYQNGGKANEICEYS